MRRGKVRVRPYRARQSPHLKFVVNYREAGKRKRAFFETQKAAQAFADEKNIDRMNAGLDGEKITAKLREMAVECAERLAKFGKTLNDATDFLVAHLEAAGRSCTAEQLVKQLLAAKEKDSVSERHLRDIRNRLGRFAEHFDGKLIAEITEPEIEAWLHSLQVGAQTRNHYQAMARLAFNYAMRHRYATSNPALDAPKARVRRPDIGILTVDQARRLLEAATPDVLPYIAIGLFAGLRRAEIGRLDWEEIDFEAGLVEVKAQKSKTAQRRFVTMQPNLREWLLPHRQLRGAVVPREKFEQLFDQARTAAGITEWPQNGLRHSFASYHLANFKNAAATALECGHHDSRVTFSHYRQLVRPREAERFWSIAPSEAAEKIVPIRADLRERRKGALSR
jgi:integrase